MILFNIDWREEMLIFPIVKRAVSELARLTLWGYVAVASLWLLGLFGVLVAGAPELCEQENSASLFLFFVGVTVCLRQLLMALLLPCVYLLTLWCHHVLLAERGFSVTRWLLLILLFFAFLHPACVLYALLTGMSPVVNEVLLTPVLYTSLFAIVLLNWFHAAAAPLRLRVLSVLSCFCLVGQMSMEGSALLLLLPCLACYPLLCLRRIAPLIASLPPRKTSDAPTLPEIR